MHQELPWQPLRKQHATTKSKRGSKQAQPREHTFAQGVVQCPQAKEDTALPLHCGMLHFVIIRRWPKQIATLGDLFTEPQRTAVAMLLLLQHKEHWP